MIDRSLDHVRRVRRESGGKVSLIGQSLGGLYAREIAKLIPEDVRCVVTLGTPFTGHPKANNAWRIYELTSGRDIESDRRFCAPEVEDQNRRTRVRSCERRFKGDG